MNAGRIIAIAKVLTKSQFRASRSGRALSNFLSNPRMLFYIDAAAIAISRSSVTRWRGPLPCSRSPFVLSWPQSLVRDSSSSRCSSRASCSQQE